MSKFIKLTEWLTGLPIGVDANKIVTIFCNNEPFTVINFSIEEGDCIHVRQSVDEVLKIIAAV